MALGIVLGATGIGSVILSSEAGGIFEAVVQMIKNPVSALVLLLVGYELNLKAELLSPVLKTILFRLVIMGGLLLVSNLIIFSIFPFDRELEIALMVLYALPAPFIIPIFSDVGADGEYVATTLSLNTLVTVILYCAIAVYSLG